MKKSYCAVITAVALVSALSLEVSVSRPALSATFNYTTISTKTSFTQNPTQVNGMPYDGTFTNTVSFGAFQFAFSGFFSVVSGTLGKALSVKAVQKSPIDRTKLGEKGIAQIEYLSEPQDVASVVGNIRVFPPNLTQYDFIFVPAPVAAELGEPTDLRLGWSVKQVSEPSITFALGLVGGLLLLTKQKSNKNLINTSYKSQKV